MGLGSQKCWYTSGDMFGELTLTGIIVLIVVILISLTIHEMMHAYVGYKLGDDTAAQEGRITLNPLAHIDPIMTVLLPIITIVAFGAPILAAKPVPFNPDRVKWDDYGAALIAAAGPFSNLALAILGALLIGLLGVSSGSFIGYFLLVFVVTNVSLFVFNMLPIPPLDGSRILYAFSPDGVRAVLEQLEQFGLFLVIGLVVLLSYSGVNPIGQLVEAVLRLLPLSVV